VKPLATLGMTMLLAASWAAVPAHAADAPGNEAEVHFSRGVRLYRETDYRSALVEFRRAYEVSHNWRLLYNIAQAEFQTLDYASALRSFRRYLADGGDKVPRARHEEVDREIASLDARVGTTPLPDVVLVALGAHRVSVAKAGFITWQQAIEPAGGDTIDLRPVLFPVATPVALPQPLPVPPPPPPPRPHGVPWVGWAVTGAFVAGAVTTGILALDASARLDSTRGKLGATDDELATASTRVKTFSLVSDVCSVGAIVVGGVSLYLTLRPSRSEAPPLAAPPSPRAGQLQLRGLSFGPRGVVASGSF
jgi:hypothetical protein